MRDLVVKIDKKIRLCVQNVIVITKVSDGKEIDSESEVMCD